MTTFSKLLTTFIDRAGISDAELARSIGVRRQTIFRWKEGIVGRPRHRQDVLDCAQRLRLTPAERDDLLIAAGFPPEDPPEAGGAPGSATSADQAAAAEPPPLPGVLEASATPDDENAPPAASGSPQRWVGMIVAMVVAGFLLVGLAVGQRLDSGPPETPLPTSSPVATRAATDQLPLPLPEIDDGETLVLISEFANYSPDLGFNVAGRLQEALAAEIRTADLLSTTVTVWPEALVSSDAAQALLADSDAVLLIWGEYDSGRVRAVLSTGNQSTGWERLLPSPTDLSATINVETPQELRLLAILTLGQIYRSRADAPNARSAFKRVLELQPDEEDTVATTKFYLASVLTADPNPDYDAAIELYDDVIALRPEWVNAHYNRGSAYLDRYYTLAGELQDLDAAIADLTWAIQRRPAFADAYLNRGIAYYDRGRVGDINQANLDLDRAVSLAPTEPRMRFNRGLARIRRGDGDWHADFDQLVAEDPDAAAAHNALCWGYALAQEPERALPHCDRALDLGLTRSVYDGRGIALAQLGRIDEALVDLQAYVDALKLLPEPAFARYQGQRVEAWIDALASGQDPFDASTLTALR